MKRGLAICICLAAAAWGAEPVTLPQLLDAAAKADLDVQAGLYNQRRDDARIDEIGHRGGWHWIMEGDRQVWRGTRYEERNRTFGRSYRAFGDTLKEDEWSVRAGLERRFFGPAEERAADIALERLDQLDRWVRIHRDRHRAALDAAEAYLDVVDAVHLRGLIARQIDHATAMRAMFAARAEVGEALQADVLEAEYDLADLRAKFLRIENRLERQSLLLRRILNRPDLRAQDLAPADLPDATQLLSQDTQALIERALNRRPDLLAAEAALDAATRFVAQHAKVLPDVDLSLTGGYRERDRDWADEGRDDKAGEFRYRVQVSIPLGIAHRNRARKERFRAEAEARRLELEARRQQAERDVRRAVEQYSEAAMQRDVQQARWAHAREEQRVVELTAERLPDALGHSPQLALYRARARTLEAASDLRRAEHDRLIALLGLAAETVSLLPELQLPNGEPEP